MRIERNFGPGIEHHCVRLAGFAGRVTSIIEVRWSWAGVISVASGSRCGASVP